MDCVAAKAVRSAASDPYTNGLTDPRGVSAGCIGRGTEIHYCISHCPPRQFRGLPATHRIHKDVDLRPDGRFVKLGLDLTLQCLQCDDSAGLLPGRDVLG